MHAIQADGTTSIMMTAFSLPLVIVSTASNKEIVINTRARIDATLFVLRLFLMSYCNRLQRHENEGGYDYIYTIPNLLILYYYNSVKTPPRDERC